MNHGPLLELFPLYLLIILPLPGSGTSGEEKFIPMLLGIRLKNRANNRFHISGEGLGVVQKPAAS